MIDNEKWLPKEMRNSQGQERRVGVEIELAGVQPPVICQLIQTLYGGEIRQNTQMDFAVANTEFGDFTVELDATFLKQLAQKHSEEGGINDHLDGLPIDILTKAAEQFVPWEVVTPPIPLSRLHQLEKLVQQLRSNNALGTRHAVHFAFGVHLNPEAPSMKVLDILSYFQAYLCLYDWIVKHEKVDLSRRVTSYIRHFNKDYIKKVIDPAYQPTQDEFIDDYLQFNPTRNRSLDLLPLLATIDEDSVRRRVEDDRVTARPTFHYRLPNCDIDNPDWGIYQPWEHWLMVEHAANDRVLLAELCAQYQQALEKITNPFTDGWADTVDNLLKANKRT